MTYDWHLTQLWIWSSVLTSSDNAVWFTAALPLRSRTVLISAEFAGGCTSLSDEWLQVDLTWSAVESLSRPIAWPLTVAILLSERLRRNHSALVHSPPCTTTRLFKMTSAVQVSNTCEGWIALEMTEKAGPVEHINYYSTQDIKIWYKPKKLGTNSPRPDESAWIKIHSWLKSIIILLLSMQSIYTCSARTLSCLTHT